MQRRDAGQAHPQALTRYAKDALNAPTRPKDDNPYPPSLPPVIVLGLTVISAGIFLWVWALMWGNWIKKLKPGSYVSTLVFVNIVPGALLFINLPSLALAMREKDTVEIARLHIGIALWGAIAVASLIATWTAIFITQRQLKASIPPTV